MIERKRAFLEALLLILSAPTSEVAKSLAETCLAPKELMEFEMLALSKDKAANIAACIKENPLPVELITALLRETLPTTSDEFVQDTAQAVIDRLKRYGFLIVGVE